MDLYMGKETLRSATNLIVAVSPRVSNPQRSTLMLSLSLKDTCNLLVRTLHEVSNGVTRSKPRVRILRTTMLSISISCDRRQGNHDIVAFPYLARSRGVSIWLREQKRLGKEVSLRMIEQKALAFPVHIVFDSLRLRSDNMTAGN
jgi:hypothetical protein